MKRTKPSPSHHRAGAKTASGPENETDLKRESGPRHESGPSYVIHHAQESGRSYEEEEANRRTHPNYEGGIKREGFPEGKPQGFPAEKLGPSHRQG